MPGIIEIIEELKKQNLSLHQQIHLASDFKKELQRYESGDLKDFKKTSIYDCYKYYFDIYCSDSVDLVDYI